MKPSLNPYVSETARLTFRLHGGPLLPLRRPRRANHRIGSPHSSYLGVINAGFQSGSQNDDTTARPSLLPAGKRQARVELPALFVTIPSANVASSLSDIAAAVAGGATAVVVTESPGEGAAQLYESAVAVKEVLRGRAMLLLADRTDIAGAVADGVLLSSTGLPTVVAKDLLQNKVSLVGRAVTDSSDAVQAAADGASFILLQPSGGFPAPDAAAIQAARQQKSGSSVPLIAELRNTADAGALSDLLAAGTNGVAIALTDIIAVAGTVTNQTDLAITDATASIYQTFAVSITPPEAGFSDSVDGSIDVEAVTSGEINIPGVGGSPDTTMSTGEPPVAQLSQLLSSTREEVIAAEKEVLGRLLSFLEESCPSLEEASLLRDAVAQLDELFLLVVVGEFNSGKSAVINALMGSRVLSEGILPTTNEISVLKWADPKDPEGEHTEQTADGLFVRYIDADILREINIVDTPGTNVILDRQQRLTEEFVPRSDLVLFVMSADRPFTDSEVRFLRYIRQWGKKVVFVLNKVDLLASEGEVGEVTGFVADNAARLLGVEGAKVVPVSARLAVEAKMASRTAEDDTSTDALTLVEQQRLAKDKRWVESRFEGLESFVRDFLMGVPGAQGAGESVRLKLRTPLFVAEALLEAARAALEAEAEVARADAASVGLVRSQLASFKAGMQKEGQVQRDEVFRQLSSISKRAASVVDATLTLSNWSALSSYVMGSKSKGALLPVASLFRQEVPKDSAASLAALVKEHSMWVASNCQRQVDNYRGFAAERLASLGRSFEELEDVEAGELRRDPEARRRWRQLRTVATQAATDSSAEKLDSPGTATGVALSVVNGFDTTATEVMLEGDVRDAVLSTASTAAGAGALGVLLTTVLPTTLEDLLALGLSAALAYASVLNLPLRRAETKKKAEAATEAVAASVQDGMKKELLAALEQCEAEVLSFIEPLEELTVVSAERTEAAVAEVTALAEEVAALQRRVADVE